MARRSSVSVNASPDTNLFRSDDLGGSDGRAVRAIQITCKAEETNGLEYRLEDPEDPAGEWALLDAGESTLLIGAGQTGRIGHIIGRGSGGATVAIVEVVQP